MLPVLASLKTYVQKELLHDPPELALGVGEGGGGLVEGFGIGGCSCISKPFEVYVKVFLCDGQGAARQAVLGTSCFPLVLQRGTTFLTFCLLL